VSDFAGKQVGNWGFGNEYELTAAIEQEGIADQVELVAQSFDMLALLNGDIDVAEAMIYNEYAQVLEAENPDTGELYQPDDLNVIDFNDVGTAMLQDAVWVNAEWIADEANVDIAERFLYASFKGWAHCLDSFDECVQVVLDNGSTLGASHQAWQLNEILGLIFPATNGIGVMNEDLWNQTVEISTSQIPELEGAEISPDAYRTDIATEAMERLEAEGFDVSGEGFEPQSIELQPGGE
jgi:NitT/TauT family transport system substrate-binding protein